MSVGSRIKEKRQSAGLSRPQLAKKLEITVSAVSNYENGISFPKEPILIKIMEVLDCDANFIFQDVIRERSAADNALSAPEQELVGYYRSMNDTGRGRLMEQARFFAGSAQYQASSPATPGRVSQEQVG